MYGNIICQSAVKYLFYYPKYKKGEKKMKNENAKLNERLNEYLNDRKEIE